MIRMLILSCFLSTLAIAVPTKPLPKPKRPVSAYTQALLQKAGFHRAAPAAAAPARCNCTRR